MDLIVGFVMRNLIAQANFVKFRDSRNFMFFEETGVGRHMASHVSHTWHAMYQHAWNMEKDIYGVLEVFVQAGTSKKEKEEKKRRRGKERKEREEKKREK